MYKPLILLLVLWSSFSEGITVEVINKTLEEEHSFNFTAQSTQRVSISSEIDGRVEMVSLPSDGFVNKGHVLFEIDRLKLSPELEHAAHEVNFLKSELTRIEKLIPQGLSNKSKRDEIKTRLEQAKASFELIEHRYSKTRIVAPFTGYLSITDLQMGDVVRAGSHLLSLHKESDTIFLDIYIPVSIASSFRPDQVIQASFREVDLSLKVIRVSPEVSRNNNLQIVRVETTKNDLFVPNQRSSISIKLNAEKGFTLGSNSILFNHEGPYTLVMADDCLIRRQVKFKYIDTNHVWVYQGLFNGEHIVNEGALIANRSLSIC